MEYELTIKNFTSVSKRRDIKKPTWFAVDNDIFSHPDFFKINSDFFKVFIWVLSVASKCNAEKIRIDDELCSHQLQIPIEQVTSSIRYFDGKRWTLHTRDVDVTDALHARTVGRYVQTDRQTNKQTDKQTRGSEKSSEINSLHPLIELWNLHASNFGKIKKSNDKRDKKLEKLWKQNSPEEWAEIIKRVNASDFCTGKNDRGWKATFDWLMQDDVYLKILEGKYDNRSKPSAKRFGYERDDKQVADEFNAIASGIDPNTGRPLE